MKLIGDLPDLLLISGLNFMLMLSGVWILPQLPEKVHFFFALSVLLSSIYFTRKMIDFIIFNYFEKPIKDNKGEKEFEERVKNCEDILLELKLKEVNK